MSIFVEHLSKDWISPIYAFFKPFPIIEHNNGCCYHKFTCMAKGCSKKICRFLDTKDARSTSNMHKHAQNCWGKDIIKSADNAKSCNMVHESIVKVILTNGSIVALFEHKGKGKVTYSHWQHTKTKMKTEIVQWVCESVWPFDIVKDHGFMSLMKTGWPKYYILSPSKVSYLPGIQWVPQLHN
ncbi:hypothetical protein DFH29DRAFT_986087 [Suillus ampliporus]|nr:hypothetical protein DFH29DRAFT_986087 [Suillus ampliporus]